MTRKILAYGDELMNCEFHFEKGAVLNEHSHPHAQCSFIISGSMEFVIDGEKVVLNGGDNVYIPPHIAHSGVCLSNAHIIDAFTPKREDFLK